MCFPGAFTCAPRKPMDEYRERCSRMHSKESKRRMMQQQQTELKHIPWAKCMAVRISHSNYSALVKATRIGLLKALL